MKQIELNITSRKELHDLFEQEFPAPYGRTLDALFDILTTYPQEITLTYASNTLYEALGERYCENFLRMLQDAAEANPKLHLYVE